MNVDDVRQYVDASSYMLSPTDMGSSVDVAEVTPSKSGEILNKAKPKMEEFASAAKSPRAIKMGGSNGKKDENEGVSG